MQTAISIHCPPELLLGLHMDAQQFAETLKWQTAIALFREGKISSGMASHWLEVPRIHFLTQAMQQGGAELLQDNEDDLARETSLL